jgi:hypothetical protein
MEHERTVLTRRERWVWRVLYATALLGAVWWYARPWLRSGRLFLIVLALSLFLVGSIWGWMRSTRDEREAERATIGFSTLAALAIIRPACSGALARPRRHCAEAEWSRIRSS